MAVSTGRHEMVHGEEHHVGFNKALQQALDQMDQHFERGQRHNVDVKFQLGVDVNSPGNVGFYQVTITTT